MTDEELKGLLEANAAENRRHFNETADRLSAENRHFFELATEGLRQEIQLVAEGVVQTRKCSRGRPPIMRAGSNAR